MMNNFEKSTEYNLDFAERQHDLAKTEVVREIVKMCNFDNFAKSKEFKEKSKELSSFLQKKTTEELIDDYYKKN